MAPTCHPFVVTALGLLAVSVLIDPQAWLDWVDFLQASAAGSSGLVYLSPFAVSFPLVPGSRWPGGGRGGRPDGPGVAGARLDGARKPGRRLHPSPCSPDPQDPRAGRIVLDDGSRSSISTAVV